MLFIKQLSSTTIGRSSIRRYASSFYSSSIKKNGSISAFSSLATTASDATKTTSATANTSSNSISGIFSQLYDKHSITKQQERNAMADRLFQFAQIRADDPRWYGPGHVGTDFRPRHAMLTMHLWFLQKRLIRDNAHSSLLIQEELFETFWDDTQKRIREAGVAEMTVNKHLKDVQQYTFQHLTHYDHAFTEMELQPKARYEELCGIVWIHVCARDDSFSSDQVQRIACYIDAQYNNIMNQLPEEYWKEGRLAWVDIPDFKRLIDNKGNLIPENPRSPDELLPHGWQKALTNAGEPYYWNPEQVTSQWEKP